MLKDARVEYMAWPSFACSDSLLTLLSLAQCPNMLACFMYLVWLHCLLASSCIQSMVNSEVKQEIRGWEERGIVLLFLWFPFFGFSLCQQIPSTEGHIATARALSPVLPSEASLSMPWLGPSRSPNGNSPSSVFHLPPGLVSYGFPILVCKLYTWVCPRY